MYPSCDLNVNAEVGLYQWPGHDLTLQQPVATQHVLQRVCSWDYDSLALRITFIGHLQ